MLTTYCRESYTYLFKPDHLNKMQKCSEIENFEKRGRSLLVVVGSPPTENYEKFTEKVREYNTREPFSFVLPVLFNNYTKVNLNRILCKIIHWNGSNIHWNIAKNTLVYLDGENRQWEPIHLFEEQRKIVHLLRINGRKNSHNSTAYQFTIQIESNWTEPNRKPNTNE